MATSIERIANGEQGLSVRTKLNNLINLAITNEQNIATTKTTLNNAVETIALLLSNGMKFKGIATVESAIDNSDDSVFFITPLMAEPIVYEQLGRIEVPAGVVGIIEYKVDLREGTKGWNFETLLTFDRVPTADSMNPVVSSGIREDIDSSNVKSNGISISKHTEDAITLQSKITHNSGSYKSSTVDVPSVTESKAGLQSASDKKKLNGIEANATLGFQIIRDVQTAQEIRAKRDVPLLLQIDKTLFNVVLNNETNTILIDPIGLAKITEAIGDGSTTVTQYAGNVKVTAKLKTVDGKSEKDISFEIPLATTSKAGLLSPSEKSQIETNKNNIANEITNRQEADRELQALIEQNVLYFELNESTGEVVATTGEETIYSEITMDEESGEIAVVQEV